MGWATFWAFFSTTHLVTLLAKALLRQLRIFSAVYLPITLLYIHVG
jgi:hypothetical protein